MAHLHHQAPRMSLAPAVGVDLARMCLALTRMYLGQTVVVALSHMSLAQAVGVALARMSLVQTVGVVLSRMSLAQAVGVVPAPMSLVPARTFLALARMTHPARLTHLALLADLGYAGEGQVLQAIGAVATQEGR